MWKFWKYKTKYNCLMEKLEEISNGLSDLEERLEELEKKEPDPELKILKGELQHKNMFIESLLIKMLEGSFNSKKDNYLPPNVSPAISDYLKKKNGEAIKPKLP